MGKPAFKDKTNAKKSQKHLEATSQTINKNKVKVPDKEKLASAARKQLNLPKINTDENFVSAKKDKKKNKNKSPNPAATNGVTKKKNYIPPKDFSSSPGPSKVTNKKNNNKEKLASPAKPNQQFNDKNSKKRKQQVHEKAAPKKPKANGNGEHSQAKKKQKVSKIPGQFVRAPPKDVADSEVTKKSKKKLNKKTKTGMNTQKDNGDGYIEQFFEAAADETELRTGSMVRVNQTNVPLSTIYDAMDDDDSDSYDSDFEYMFDSEDGEEVLSESSSNSEDYEYSDVESYDSNDYESSDMWEENSNDTDYAPSDCEDDLYISRGQAKIYDIDDNISFDSDSAQIKELDGKSYDSDSDESCPELVPIEDTPVPVVDEPDTETNLIRSLEDEERLANETDTIYKTSSDTLWNCARFFKSKASDQVLMLLSKPIFASGFMRVEVVAGELEIAGYQLTAGEIRDIYGAKHFPSLNMTPIVQQKTKVTLNLDAYTKDFSEKHLNELQSLYDGDTNVIVLLRKLEPNNRMSILNTYMPEVLFKRISSGTLRGCEYLLQTTFQPQGKCKSPLMANAEWDAVRIEENNSRVIIVGGKNAGKSTLAQHLINKNVKKFDKMLLIDLDIGQPIVNVSQTVSATLLEGPILGAGFLQNFKHDKTIFYGSPDVQASPVKYINCVKELLKYCHKTHRNIPWIINTMGMVKGYGLELLVGIIKLSKPTVLIQIQHKRPDSNFPHILTPTLVNDYRFLLFQPDFGNTIGSKSKFKIDIFETNARGSSSIDLPLAKEIRMIQTVATLGECLAGCDWLNEVHPVCASIADLSILTMDDQELKGEAALKAINANLVYLCQKIKKEPEEDDVHECFGIGIVRAIDQRNGTVFLLTQTRPEEMAKISVLALGMSPLPECLLLKQNQMVEGFIPYIYNTENETVASKKIKKMQHYKT